MPSQDIVELQHAVAELQQGLRSVIDSSNTMFHLLAFVFTTRCMATPDPMRAYKDTAQVLLASIGGTERSRQSGNAAFDAALPGIRHIVSQFLLTLNAHVEEAIATQESVRSTTTTSRSPDR